MVNVSEASDGPRPLSTTHTKSTYALPSHYITLPCLSVESDVSAKTHKRHHRHTYHPLSTAHARPSSSRAPIHESSKCPNALFSPLPYVDGEGCGVFRRRQRAPQGPRRDCRAGRFLDTGISEISGFWLRDAAFSPFFFSHQLIHTSCISRGSGWRIHCGVEVTELSTNRYDSVTHQLTAHTPRFLTPPL